MQHRGKPLGQLLRVGFQALAQRAQRAVASVPYGHHEVGPGEDHDLAGVDHLAGGGQFLVLDVGDGLEDGEEDVAVLLDLGALVGVDGVLDGERVQAEQVGDAGELRLGGLVQAEPDEAATAVLAYPGDGLLHAGGGLLADPVAVDDAVDDGGSERGAGRVAEVHLASAARQPGDPAQVADHRHVVLPSSGGQCGRRG